MRQIKISLVKIYEYLLFPSSVGLPETITSADAIESERMVMAEDPVTFTREMENFVDEAKVFLAGADKIECWADPSDISDFRKWKKVPRDGYVQIYIPAIIEVTENADPS